ncbi:hypothetical protein EYB33_19830 [Lysinibacillus sphaericus]|uniref:hypothetical protein n=1 Tax=Lysinibacillus sphaericus TaxID=1421 RepID=UPI001E2A1738|nr:hypothetical protein [Lysinibacillus sphaericus]UDK98378.1 hypothetical protein EYB33_19830 [Lysinibacillus sphaericus]
MRARKNRGDLEPIEVTGETFEEVLNKINDELKKKNILKSAYWELQEEYDCLRHTSLDNAHKLFKSDNKGDEEGQLYYSYQLQCSDEQLEEFEKDYLLLLEYIFRELGSETGTEPFKYYENSIELAQGYFNDWILNYTIKEVKENE